MLEQPCDADLVGGGGGGRRGPVDPVAAIAERGLTVIAASKKKKKEQAGGCLVAVSGSAGQQLQWRGRGLLVSRSPLAASPQSPSLLPRSRSLAVAGRVTLTGDMEAAGGGTAVVGMGMEGFGAFRNLDGGTCEGFGRKLYANGDCYVGNWKQGLQEGHGRYVWRNGNQYVGEWRGGVISGRGVLVWADGRRYEGRWEGGVPCGGGVFTWPEDGCYVGGWAKDPKNQRQLQGTFYPKSAAPTAARHCQQQSRRSNPYPNPSPFFFLSSPSSLVDGNGDIQHVFPPFQKRFSVDGASGKGGGITDKSLPRICIWESDGEDITCEIIDTLEASMLCRNKASFGKASGECGTERRLQRSPCSLDGNKVKKPGQTISKGHKNYELMLNLQLGIRYSVGKLASATQIRELRQGDFDPREKFWTRFPPEGSKITPPHQSVEFRWKDYCPMVFRHLRRLFSVDPADYMLAICGDDALRELSSPGKSGSLFYLTQDDRFIIKTVKKSEVKVLIRMLPNYYQHVCHYKGSLVTKFYGVHCIKPIGGQKVRFIVMGNLFCSEYRVHRRFDLKGSSHGRMIDRAEGDIDETTTLKDLDLNFVFRLQQYYFEELLDQIDRDCEFLEAEGIMDYSLLVGLHFCNDTLTSKTGKRSASEFHYDESGFEYIQDDRKPLIRLGVNMPARAEQTTLRNGSDIYVSSWGGSTTPSKCGETYDVILNVGIIDILQDYDISKKLEHAYKSLQADPTSISAVDPKLYSKRFRDFIKRIFVEDR